MGVSDEKEVFISELKTGSISFLVSKWIIGRIPHIFQSDMEQYLSWKEVLSEKIGVDSHAITFTGSASVGFSLNPYKHFRVFDDESDIDVAIISHHYFDVSWHFMRNLGSLLYSLNKIQKDSIADHVSRLIYWGTIATDKIVGILPFGKEWLTALSEMAQIPPTEKREINFRIYKDFESLRAYQINNLNQIRDDILSIAAGVRPDEIILRHNT